MICRLDLHALEMQLKHDFIPSDKAVELVPKLIARIRELERAEAQADLNPVELIGAEFQKCHALEAHPRDVDVLLDALNCTLKEHGFKVVDLDDEAEAQAVPEGWKISPDEEGWSIVSPSGDGCFLFDNDRLHGQTMEGAAVREVMRQLCSSLVYPLAAAEAPNEGNGHG
jgi:hypothetical protein